MSRLRPLAVLALAFLCGISGAVGFGLVARLSDSRITPAAPRQPVALQLLSKAPYVAPQIAAEDIDAIMMRGIKTVIDLRPDGEAADQPGSDLIGLLAKNRGMRFAYIPVPHGDVPDAVVDRLAETLTHNPGPVLLYCHSGRRAARTWALAEASRPDGLAVADIQAHVIAVGQSVDDLSGRLSERVARRSASQ